MRQVVVILHADVKIFADSRRPSGDAAQSDVAQLQCDGTSPLRRNLGQRASAALDRPIPSAGPWDGENAAQIDSTPSTSTPRLRRLSCTACVTSSGVSSRQPRNRPALAGCADFRDDSNRGRLDMVDAALLGRISRLAMCGPQKSRFARSMWSSRRSPPLRAQNSSTPRRDPRADRTRRALRSCMAS